MKPRSQPAKVPPGPKEQPAHEARAFLSRRAEATALIGVALLAILVYANAFKGEFVYDDVKQIVGNELIQEGRYFGQAMLSDVWAFKGDKGRSWSNYWRPVFILWLMLNYRLFGLESTVGWHVGNALLHAVVAVLAYRWLRRLGLSGAAALAIVLLFTVHPVHVESVAWISGSPDMLLAAAILGSLIGLVAHLQNPHPTRIGASYALYALALFCKEIGVFFPVLIFLTAYVVGRPGWPAGTAGRRALRVVAPFLAITGGYIVLHLVLLGQTQIETPWSTGPLGIALTAPSLLFFYIRQCVFPFWIGPSYPLRPVSLETLTLGNFWLPLAAVLLAASGLWLASRKHPVRWIGLALFVLPLVPAMNINAFTPEQLVHDRYLYLPLLGLLMVVVPALGNALEGWIPRNERLRNRVLVGGAAACCVPLTLATVSYNRAWTSELSLWTRAVESDPTSASNLSEYGRLMFHQGSLAEAKAATDRALAIHPVTTGYLIRADIAVAEKRFAEAESDLERVLENQPDNAGAYERLAVCYERQGRLTDAERVLRRAREKVPHRLCALTDNLAIVLYLQNRKDEALAEMESVRSQIPREYGSTGRNVLFHLGTLYAERNRVPEARSALSEYLRATAGAVDADTLRMRAESTTMLVRLKGGA